MEYLQLQQLLAEKTKEDIIASAYSSLRKDTIIIRLYNTKPDIACIHSLFDELNIGEFTNVTKSIVEYVPGTSYKTGSRKVDMDTYIHTFEELIKALDNPDYVIPTYIKNYIYEPKIMTKEGLVTKSSL